MGTCSLTTSSVLSHIFSEVRQLLFRIFGFIKIFSDIKSHYPDYLKCKLIDIKAIWKEEITLIFVHILNMEEKAPDNLCLGFPIFIWDGLDLCTT